MFSVFAHCWLGVRKGIQPVKKWVIRYWHGYLSRASANDFHIVQLMPLPAHHLLLFSCCIKIQIGLTFLVLVYPGCPGKEAIRWVFCQPVCLLLSIECPASTLVGCCVGCRWVCNTWRASATSCSVAASARRQTSHGQAQRVDYSASPLSPRSLRQYTSCSKWTL